jgi:hypothetical protein
MRCENKTFLQNDPGFLQEISSTAVEVGLEVHDEVRDKAEFRCGLIHQGGSPQRQIL